MGFSKILDPISKIY